MTRRRIAIAFLGAWTCAALATRPAFAQQAPYADTGIWAAPASGGAYGFVPSGSLGPTPHGEISVVRERWFDDATGPAPTDGISAAEANWAGLDPANPFADGLYAQVLYVRIGPTVDCGSDPDAVVDLQLSAGLRIVGVVAKNQNLGATDASWGVPGIVYASKARGFEGSDTLTVDPLAGRIRIVADEGCGDFTDDLRILVDFGDAYLPGATLTVTADQADCAAGDVCNAGIGLGGLQVAADPDPSSDHPDRLEVVIPLGPGLGAEATPVPVLDCPIASLAASVAGGVDGAPGARVSIVVEDPVAGTSWPAGEALAGADGRFELAFDPARPWTLAAGWRVQGRATDEAGGRATSPAGPWVVVGDPSCGAAADPGPEPSEDTGTAFDAGVDPGPDAGPDAGTDPGLDAGPDAATDPGEDAADLPSDPGLPLPDVPDAVAADALDVVVADLAADVPTPADVPVGPDVPAPVDGTATDGTPDLPDLPDAVALPDPGDDAASLDLPAAEVPAAPDVAADAGADAIGPAPDLPDVRPATGITGIRGGGGCTIGSRGDASGSMLACLAIALALAGLRRRVRRRIPGGTGPRGAT